jgi:hypothetical protein
LLVICGIVPHVAAGTHGRQAALQGRGFAQGGLHAQAGRHGLQLPAQHAGGAVHRVHAVLHLHALVILLKPLVALAQLVGFHPQGTHVVGRAQAQLLPQQLAAVEGLLPQGRGGGLGQAAQLRRAIGR